MSSSPTLRANPTLSLEIPDDETAELPVSLVTSELSLAEIGALFCLQALTSIDHDPELLKRRFQSAEMQAASDALNARGIVKHKIEDGVLLLTIDLEAIGL